LYLKIAVKDVWGSKTKQSKAIKKWHNKAMLVDPRKVEITIIWAEMPKTYESQENLGNIALNSKTKESTIIAGASTQDTEEGLKAVDPKFEIAENFFATESDSKIVEPNTIEKQDSYEAAFEQTSETLRPEAAKTISTNDGVETLETLDTILQNSEWDTIETQADSETVADLETTEQNPESIAPVCSTVSTTTIEYLKDEESVRMKATDAYESVDYACELIAKEKEPLNIRFLRVLEKTRSKWYNDKQLAKIVQKMEKGKNLKRKEFDRVYMHIRTYGGCN
jgi:hypothetical protein